MCQLFSTLEATTWYLLCSNAFPSTLCVPVLKKMGSPPPHKTGLLCAKAQNMKGNGVFGEQYPTAGNTAHPQKLITLASDVPKMR